jgi:hypothetical protein
VAAGLTPGGALAPYEHEVAAELVAGEAEVLVLRRLAGVEAHLLMHPGEHLGAVDDGRGVP